MSPASFASFLVLALALWAVPMCAQTTHLVGPGGLPQIRDALAIAADGDVIEVLPGTYAHFTSAVAVTIRASLPGTVSVRYDPAFAPPGCLGNSNCASLEGPTWFDGPPWSTTTVVGIRFAAATIPTSLPGTTIRHQTVVRGAATVVFDQCAFYADDVTPISVQQYASGIFVGCDAAAGGDTYTAHGLHVGYRGMVSAVSSRFIGNSPSQSAPGYGIYQAPDSILHGSRLVVKSGATNALGGRPAIVSTVWRGVEEGTWLVDSQLVGGGRSCAIVGVPGRTQLARTAVQPSHRCPSWVWTGLGVHQPAPPTNASTYTLELRTNPGLPVLLCAAHSITPARTTLFAPGPIYLYAPFLVAVGVADAAGSLSLSLALPPGPFVGTPLWFQAVSGAGLPLQLSPVVGGLVR